MTTDEYHELKKVLSRIDADTLASFIVDLAVQNETVAEATVLLSQRGNPEACFKAIKARISGLRRGKRFYHYREAGYLEQKIHVILEAIERDLLPIAPQRAMEAVGELIRSDAAVMERVDDSSGGMGMVFRKACELFAIAAEAAGKPAEAESWFFRLAEENDYGVRDALFDYVPRILGKESLERLIADWRESIAGKDFKEAFTEAIRLSQTAKAMGDPELFEEAKLCGETPESYPAIALDVARFYLECGRPDEALAKVPASENLRSHWGFDELLVEIYRALGDESAQAEIHFRQFEMLASAKEARNYLQTIPQSRQEAERQRLERMVSEGEYRPMVKARFFTAMGKPAIAASIIEENAESFSETYYSLTELAKPLAKLHPRAATLLYREAVEQTLAEGKSKNYRHAVRYIRQLEKLAEAVKNWSAIPNHDAWLDGIRSRHARKSAFWKAMGEACSN